MLHDGIGVPRLTDKGGNDTLPSSHGTTNDEAEFRARQKGLFQSMDTVRNTAISWTLGKVVIEASRAVGTLPNGRWTPISAARDHLRALPIWLLVAYAVVAVLLLALFVTLLRRRAPRRRKVYPFKFALPSVSLRGWIPVPAHEADLYIEEGSSSSGGEGPTKRGRAGRLRLWSRRVSAALRNARFDAPPRRAGLQRMASMPLSTGPFPSSGWAGMSGSGGSQPPSPRGGMRSASMMDIASYPSYYETPGSGASSSVASTPRPPRPRTTSYNTGGAEGGWNDPPMSMFGHGGAATPASHAQTPTQGYESSSGADDEWPGPKPAKKYSKKRSGALTPSAGPGGERVLSRNSSRANLSDSGQLAQRSASRAATPHLS